MTRPPGLSAKFIKKMSDAYIRLNSELEDEGEITRRLDLFIKKGLALLGLKLVGDKLEDRSRKIAKVAIQYAKREMERQDYLLDVVLSEKDGYSINFLPDVRIPRTPKNEERWSDFLNTLAAKTRIGSDKVTGEIGVLYRKGEWLGTLMLADEMPSIHIIPDITVVQGDLVARGALKVHAGFTHQVQVLGGLHVNHDILRQDPPPVDYRGPLTLYGMRSFEDVPVQPERLKAWGAAPGSEIRLRHDRFEFVETAGPDGQRYELKGLNVLSSFHWKGDAWLRSTQERVDPELFEAAYGRLHRICLTLGLSGDFIAKSVSRMPDNIDRLALYLVLSLQGAPDKDPESPSRSAALNLLDGLAALRSPFTQRRVEGDPVRQALKTCAVEDAEQTATLTALPRPKINEKQLREDLELITRCREEPVPVDEFLNNGLLTLRALNAAFRSSAMADRVVQAFAALKEAFDAVAARMDEEYRPDFTTLLAEPKATLALLDQGLAPLGGKVTTHALKVELRDLGKCSVKVICRRISNVSMESDEERYAEDAAMLRQFFEMKTLDCASLDIDPARFLALILPRLRSRGGALLEEARQVLNGQPARGHVAQALGDRLAGLTPEQCLNEVRTWLSSFLAVVRAYNQLTVSEDTAPSPESDRQAKEIAMISLPPHVTREINLRMKRMALTWSLGSDFLEPIDSAVEDNLNRVRFYLALNLGITPASPRSTLSKEDRPLVEEAFSHFSTLLHCLDTADFEEAEEALAGLNDAALDTLAAVFAKPRHKAPVFALRKDRDYLDGLQDTRQTLQKVFVSPGRFLLFANAALKSNEVKRGVSDLIKPVYFALAKLGKDAAGVTTNDLLREACDQDDFLNRIALAGKDDEARAIEKALSKICELSIDKLAGDLRKYAPPGSTGPLGRDRDFLGRVLEVEGNPLGALQLDVKTCIELLLMNLESHIADRVKTMANAGQLSGRPAKRIVAMVKSRLDWEMAVIRAYNRLTTPAA